jgi:hypothetical protein
MARVQIVQAVQSPPFDIAQGPEVLDGRSVQTVADRRTAKRLTPDISMRPLRSLRLNSLFTAFARRPDCDPFSFRYH